MLVSGMALQNAIMMSNNATLNMFEASDRMLNAATNVNFGNSQPLKPSFSSLAADELIIKANETRVTVFNKLINALTKKTGEDIKKSAPKYAGLNYKA